MIEASEHPMGYRFPKLVVLQAIYLYHRCIRSYKDVQEFLSRGWMLNKSLSTLWSKSGPTERNSSYWYTLNQV